MSILDTPIASFAESELRRPEVLETARRGPVEIRGSDSADPLLLIPRAVAQTLRELRELVELFLLMTVELRRAKPSPVVLGDVGFVAALTLEQRERFLEGYAEALGESVRTESPAPVRAYMAIMAASERRSDRPDFDGRVTEETRAVLASRLSS